MSNIGQNVFWNILNKNVLVNNVYVFITNIALKLISLEELYFPKNVRHRITGLS